MQGRFARALQNLQMCAAQPRTHGQTFGPATTDHSKQVKEKHHYMTTLHLLVSFMFKRNTEAASQPQSAAQTCEGG